MNNTDWQDALGALLDSGSLQTESSENDYTSTNDSIPIKKDKLSISFERKGRAGKEVTIISGFTGSNDELNAIASSLKSKLGAGGSARGGEILLQGDRREKVAKLLTEMGYRI